MLIIIVILILVFIMLFFLSKGQDADYINSLNKKEEKLIIFYPLSAYLRSNLNSYFPKISEQNQISKFQRLYPELDGKEAYKHYLYQKDSSVLLIVFVALIFSLIAGFASLKKEDMLEGNRIKRPPLGMEQTFNLLFHAGNIQEEKLYILLQAKKLSGEELDLYLYSLEEQIIKSMLLNNESVDCIRTDLYFMDKILGANITLRWRPDDYSLIGVSGKIYNSEVANEGIITSITVFVDYYEEEVARFIIPVKIFPPILSKQEHLYKEIIKAVEEFNRESSYDEYFILPNSIDDVKIEWQEKKENKSGIILIFGCVVAVAIGIAISQNIKNIEKQRTRQMYIDYANIICKFTLLLSAGMTIRSVWECIAKDYEKRKSYDCNKKFVKHYAYEEMLITLREIELGVSEGKAYENYGKRCSMLPYIKFTTILVQNLKKGTTGILPLLEIEARNAFAERKELSKRLGEEAGTKLQGPLMMYLILILIIILVPAFMSFV